MLGTSVQLGRRHGDDRFYDAAKARRGQQNPMSTRNPGGGAVAVAVTPAKEKAAVVEESPLKTSTGISNLDRFLMSIIPSLPAQNSSKALQRTMRGWRTCDVEFTPYFVLGDLWESFKEWSAYGAGVPLVLNGSDSVVQYYVPYLSGIQLYGEASGQIASSRRAGEDSDGDCCLDSSSDGSSDYEHEKGLKFCRDWKQSHLTNSSILRVDRLSESHVSSQEDFSSDDSVNGNSRGCLLFEYFELDPPYCREPLADKISNLASRFPHLRTSRSCDLLPTSWISVAWYPIYRIPTGPTLKDLDACFLTFHSLSTQKRGDGASGAIVTYPRGIDAAPTISLPAFGLASYKFKEAMWSSGGGNERQLASSLLQAADNWLQHLHVGHPDYQFFVSHGAFRR